MPLDSPLLLNSVLFALAALVIAWAGTRLAAMADDIADRTGPGEAVTGTVFLGLTTALPGLTASVVAAMEGRPGLAIGNALGGIALQTTFIACADLLYRRASLAHAAASAPNLIQTALLILLLCVVLLALTGPEVSVGHVHVATPVLVLTAVLGFFLVFRTSREPMWRPKKTSQTVLDEPDEQNRSKNLGDLVVRFIAVALVVTAAGAVVAHTTGNIADQTGMGDTVAGGLLSGVATSLPELGPQSLPQGAEL